METEWEATFWPIDKDSVRARLEHAGASLVHQERLMKRYTFYFPSGEDSRPGFVRVRDEGDKVTMSIKDMSGSSMAEQKELEISVNDFQKGRAFLNELGCIEKNYQETKREEWSLDNVTITIDEWPFLLPLCEVEGGSEEEVRIVSEKLGFAWREARFCAAGHLYEEQYGTSNHAVNRHPRLVFAEENPFIEPGN